jgi:lambda family phage tail tape measure protein
MANEDLRVRISTQVQGLDQVESLKNAVRQLQGAATPAAADLQKLKNAAMALGSATDRTENDLRRSINALKDVRAQLSLTDGEYKKLTRTINQYQTQLDKATGAQQRGGRASQFAQTAGAVAASGVFGGPEGLIGSGIGAVVGGPAGALAGGAIGAQVGMLRQQLGGTATLAADLEKQRIALKLVLKDTAEYNDALQFLAKTSKDYAIPQDRLIKGFTQLAASVTGAGGNIKDTKTAFEGVAAGIRGTGRSLEDLDGALLATAQVFSKGKVTAEELRGQIGERLPGAFTLFAEAIGKTPQELDKALERGEISLQDFLTFSKKVFGEYGENAKIIAESPAAAGDRLQTSLKNLGESVGKLLLPIGASFQNTFADIAGYIDGAARRLANFLGLNKTDTQKIGELNNQIIIQQRAIQRERDKVQSGVTTKDAAEYAIKEFEGRIVKLQAEAKTLKALQQATADQQKDTRKGLADQASGKADLDTKALDKLKKEQERNALEQQRLNEVTAKARIALDDAVFRNSMELVRKRYEYEQELITKQRDLWVKSQVGAARGAAGLISGFLNEMDGLSTRLLQAKDAVESAKQGLKSAQSMAATTIGASGAASAAGRYIQGGIGPRGANQYGPHFDIKRSDGGYYSRNALDAYVQVNGRPLSSGVTVPGGEYGAPRSYGGHAGRDYAFGAGAALTLTGGAKWMGSQKGSYGDAAAFMTPDGKVYKIIHGRFEGSAGAGAGAAARRDVTAEGGADVAKAGLDSANQAFAMTEQQLGRLKGIIGQGFVLDFTDQIRQQIEAQKEANFMLEYRNKLEESGMRSEFVDAELKKAEAFKEVTGQISSANQALEILEANGQGNTEQANLLRQAIEALVKLFPDLKKGIDDAAKAQAAAADKAKSFGSQFKDTFKQAYDSATNLGANLAGIATSGIDGLTNAIVNFASTGKAAFKEFAASVLKDLGAMLIKFAIFKAVGSIFGFGATGGATGPDSSAPLKTFATGGVMSNNVVPMRRYASGGIARSPEVAIYGERGPEAYVPLPDGRSIPVKMQQRNDALNRYRPMGATGTMTADGDPAAATGGAAPGSSAIDVRYSVERINNVEYVTAEQFRSGMQQAASQGAQRGEQRALRSLQQSTAVRSRVGIR